MLAYLPILLPQEAAAEPESLEGAMTQPFAASLVLTVGSTAETSNRGGSRWRFAPLRRVLR